MFLLTDYGCENSYQIIVGHYVERKSDDGINVKQYLILTTGQEYYKVNNRNELEPNSVIPGKYVIDGYDCNFEINLHLTESELP